MHVRFAQSDDIKDLVRLRLDFFDDDPVLTVTGEKRALIIKTLERYYKRHLNRDFFAALAEVDGEIAAVSFLVVYDKPANYRFPSGKTGEILNVFTYTEYRLNGYVTATLKLLIDKAREKNVSFIELMATPSGKRVYEKLGFEESRNTHSTEMVLKLI